MTINVGASTSTTVNLAHNHVDLNAVSSETRQIISDGERFYVMLFLVQGLIQFVALELARQRREGVAQAGA